MFPKLRYNFHQAHLMNLIQLFTRRKQIFLTIKFSKKTFHMLKFFYKIKYINFFYVFRTITNQILCRVSGFYYKNINIYNTIKFYSTPSRSIYISYKAMRLFAKRSDNTILLLSTSKGIMTHYDALKLHLSGFVFAHFFI